MTPLLVFSTTGGSGGPTVTVTTFDQLTAAVQGNAAKIVIVNGAITGSGRVRIGSNTSVLGNPGASTCIPFVLELDKALNGFRSMQALPALASK